MSEMQEPPRRGRPPSNVDAQRWALLVSEVLKANGLDAETAAHPRGPAHASPQTIRKWQKADGGVTADMVVDFARALGYPAARALIEVGWLQPEEFGVLGLVPLKPAPPAKPRDRVIRVLDETMSDKRIPESARRLLRNALQGTFDDWLESQAGPRPPREPKMRDR